MTKHPQLSDKWNPVAALVAIGMRRPEAEKIIRRAGEIGRERARRQIARERKAK